MTTKVLMCTPEYFGVDYSINPWMDDNIGKVDLDAARRQWQALKDALSQVVQVEVIPGRQRLPDMVFAANAGRVAGKTFYPSVFKHHQRQGETLIWAEYFLEKRYNIQWPNGTFEGEGDCLKTAEGWTWAGHGFRSDSGAIHSNFRLKLKDPRFYHLDTCFCPLLDNTLLWYRKAFEEPNLESIAFCFKHIIDVSEEDALNFACNAVVLGNHVFLPKNKSVTPQLEALGYIVKEFDMSEFIKSGGACKCLVLYLD